ncbi:group II intron maturase-specific domain-containing protein [Ammoniphilus sp. YIM 78166]|uniref:group II intron maturase-specific domain-containing protein n=1 Tax=Ammoniphilus sp. YIM 78166 TaxID=1644106 RepID=UPI0035136008
MRQTIRGWRMDLKPDITIHDLSRMFNASIRGWLNYYGHFYKSQLYSVFRYMNKALVQWVRRKYVKLERHKTRAIKWHGQLAKNLHGLFAHCS